MSDKSVHRRNQFKVIILGESSVGKTSLIHRYIHNMFKEKLKPTLGCHYYTDRVVVDEGEALLQIWDTAGLERFDTISRHYYRNANAAVVCVDVMNSRSYSKLNYWIEQIMLDENECKVYICCTKNDLFKKYNRLVSQEMIETSAKACDGRIFMTSSKTGDGVYEMFQEIASDLLISYTNKENGGIRLHESEKKKRKCCSRN